MALNRLVRDIDSGYHSIDSHPQGGSESLERRHAGITWLFLQPRDIGLLHVHAGCQLGL